MGRKIHFPASSEECVISQHLSGLRGSLEQLQLLPSPGRGGRAWRAQFPDSSWCPCSRILQSGTNSIDLPLKQLPRRVLLVEYWPHLQQWSLNLLLPPGAGAPSPMASSGGFQLRAGTKGGCGCLACPGPFPSPVSSASTAEPRAPRHRQQELLKFHPWKRPRPGWTGLERLSSVEAAPAHGTGDVQGPFQLRAFQNSAIPRFSALCPSQQRRGCCWAGELGGQREQSLVLPWPWHHCQHPHPVMRGFHGNLI